MPVGGAPPRSLSDPPPLLWALEKSDGGLGEALRIVSHHDVYAVQHVETLAALRSRQYRFADRHCLHYLDAHAATDTKRDHDDARSPEERRDVVDAPMNSDPGIT